MLVLQPSKRARRHTGTTGNCVGEQNANPQSKMSKGNLLKNQQSYNLNRFIQQGYPQFNYVPLFFESSVDPSSEIYTLELFCFFFSEF